MKKKILILSIIIVLILIISISFYFYYLSKPKYLTNTAELYSSFTPYMQENMDSHLQLIDCEPEKYYYGDSSICFVCDEMDACFGYGLVNRFGEKKMNPKGLPYLKNIKEISVKAADFYNDGLASNFYCRKESRNSLRCEKSLIFRMDDSQVKMFLSDLSRLEEVSKDICTYFGKEWLKCEDLDCECEGMKVLSSEDGEISYHWM